MVCVLRVFVFVARSLPEASHEFLTFFFFPSRGATTRTTPEGVAAPSPERERPPPGPGTGTPHHFLREKPTPPHFLSTTSEVLKFKKLNGKVLQHFTIPFRDFSHFRNFQYKMRFQYNNIKKKKRDLLAQKDFYFGNNLIMEKKVIMRKNILLGFFLSKTLFKF